MRLFVSIPFEADTREGVIGLTADLRRLGVTGNVTRPENLHLTLAFLGETRRLEQAKRAVQGCTEAAFSLALPALRVSGGGRNPMLWLAVARSSELSLLQGALAQRLRDEGFSIEQRPFSPHITLVREARLPQGFSPSREGLPIPLRVNAVHLMRSDRVNGTLTYTTVFHQPLKGDSHV